MIPFWWIKVRICLNLSSFSAITISAFGYWDWHCVVILYHLEAAIRGVEIKQLDGNCKSELKAYFKQL